VGGGGQDLAGIALSEESIMNAAFGDWRWRLALGLYRLMGPVLLLISLVPWLKKTIARGGWQSPLGERFGWYREDKEWELERSTHIHAVSVGETLIALKLLRAWQRSAEQRVVLAVGTATAWELAMRADLSGVRVVYAPVDWWPFVRSYLRRFRPERVVLVEAEAWPELMQQCQGRGIAVSMVNARLSARSERRFRKFSRVIRPIFAGLEKIGVQERADAERFIALGCQSEAVLVTGSVKFDPGADVLAEERADFRAILDAMRGGKRIVLAASTHDGEEVFIGDAVRAAGAFYVCVPRHAERRDEVKKALMQAGWNVSQRSTGEARGGEDCYLVDTTGELRDWTTLADVVVIGKSFLAEGGQNPCEAVMASKCVVTGPHMENFQPLTDDMIRAGGLVRVADAAELSSVLTMLVADESTRKSHTQKAMEILRSHQGATNATVKVFLS
jgi:3-deoxy-D-manno-octulosonic-acid transferase